MEPSWVFNDKPMSELEEAKSSETSPSRLIKLANSSDMIVAIKVLKNPNTPKSVYKQVIEGENPTISCVMEGYNKPPLNNVYDMRQACLFGNPTFGTLPNRSV